MTLSSLWARNNRRSVAAVKTVQKFTKSAATRKQPSRKMKTRPRPGEFDKIESKARKEVAAELEAALRQKIKEEEDMKTDREHHTQEKAEEMKIIASWNRRWHYLIKLGLLEEWVWQSNDPRFYGDH
jgi:hypothetical protein